jgi:hypothetical protein
MIFETQIAYTGINAKGERKELKENYLVDDLLMFREVEEKLYDTFKHLEDIEVKKIKRSGLMEIANSKPSGTDDAKVFVITIVSTFLTEDGKKKEKKYHVACFAKDIQTAHKFAEQYIAQGLEDMELKQIKETDFIDVIK